MSAVHMNHSNSHFSGEQVSNKNDYYVTAWAVNS